MELCNEVAGSYRMPSSKNIAATMKQLGKKTQVEQTAQSFSRYLKKATTRKGAVNNALRNVYKVHAMHDRTRIVRERRLRRANRMSIIHPSKLADGNYNS